MRIRHGWSGEFRPNQWGKFDVSLDEGDVDRMIVEIGIRGTFVPLSTIEAFSLLNSEAQRLLIAGMVARYQYPREHGQAEIAEHTVHRDKILAVIKARFDAS